MRYKILPQVGRHCDGCLSVIVARTRNNDDDQLGCSEGPKGCLWRQTFITNFPPIGRPHFLKLTLSSEVFWFLYHSPDFTLCLERRNEES